jgi:putative membrane protein
VPEIKKYLFIFLRGIAMGAADVVPGASGGTIAFITGIYQELIDSLRNCDHRAMTILWRQGVNSAWQHINGNFLLALFSGVLVSIFSLAKIVTYCLSAWPIGVWSFFFGLILAASLHLFRQIEAWSFRLLISLCVGIILAVLIGEIKPAELSTDWWVLIGAGSIAICAMILPGISGGFLLLVMGLYQPILLAVSEIDLSVLSYLLIGCVFGLLAFSHFLSWLLQSFHAMTMACLTGFLLGSLSMLWPWKVTVDSVIDRHGELRVLVSELVSPVGYIENTGQSAQVLVAIALCITGFMVVFFLEYFSVEKNNKESAQ